MDYTTLAGPSQQSLGAWKANCKLRTNISAGTIFKRFTKLWRGKNTSSFRDGGYAQALCFQDTADNHETFTENKSKLLALSLVLRVSAVPRRVSGSILDQGHTPGLQVRSPALVRARARGCVSLTSMLLPPSHSL